MIRILLRGLLGAAYAALALFGFLSGMFSEALIGSTHPWAGSLANAIVWLGVAISISAVVCPLTSLRMKARPVQRWILLAIPFLLLAAQMVLSGAADML